jgi:hypothetical protein
LNWIADINTLDSTRNVGHEFYNIPQGSRLRGKATQKIYGGTVYKNILTVAKLRPGKRIKVRVEWEKSMKEAKDRIGL